MRLVNEEKSKLKVGWVNEVVAGLAIAAASMTAVKETIWRRVKIKAIDMR